ncbi:molybdopterin-dependent oxidoreductase [Cellulosilyticum sp. I15G10I2]|uniref:molybdopterin-dependent oxidoreductase n=1 Tax=Cellulosilyticum sp. I15G10I2 TaxID=1892843 RepID=UPI00085C4DA4|nr:molybdopterin cofactor-binding domain-containing protein [Cellulosilyticum sp. I15G10I2]
MSSKIKVTVNGIKQLAEVEEDLSLLRYLRECLGLMGTKNGCEKGHCGTCMVIINGAAKRACLLKMTKLEGAVIETIEGLANGERLHYIQQAFIDEGAVQCGFCTPGMVMSTKALLDRIDHPTEAQIKEALKHNICRCTGYTSILKSVRRAADYKYTLRSLEENKSDNYIGVSVPKIDATAKVQGKPIFADDYTAEGMIYGTLLFSEYAHAKIKSVNIEKAKMAPGVELILTGQDIKGRNSFGLFFKDQPVIASDTVRFLGEVVAAVFAKTRKQADFAKKLIEVSYEVLPPILSPLEAIKETSALVHEDKENNIVHHVQVRKGDADKAFETADVVVEDYYYTPAIEHAYLETEACLARPEADGTLTVFTGNQGSIAFQEMIASTLNIEQERVRVIYTPCGGGFGGKEEPTVQIHASLAAFITGKPVKMVLTREESIRMSTKRHAMHIWMKHGATKEGKIVAVESKVIGDAGAYISMTMPVVFRSAVTATGPYVVEHVKADSYGVYTHNNTGGAFRGFGSTQVSFACEVQMDKIARKLSIDPAVLRAQNGFRPGSVTGTGQILGKGIGYLETLEAVKDALAKEKQSLVYKEARGDKKVGFGLASSYKNVGIGTGKPDKAGAIIEVMENGKIQVRIGATDMGQGSDTIMAQIAATALEVPYSLMEVIACDTKTCPDGGMTTASRQTYVTGNAVKLAAEKLKDKLYTYLSLAASDEKITQQALEDAYQKAKGEGEVLKIEVEYMPPKTYPHRILADKAEGMKDEELNIHYAYCFASAGVVVEVDTQTGKVKVLKVFAAQDVGKAINPQNIKGQIEGAVVMGMGFALTEEFLEDETTIITDTLKKLGVPKIEDAPEIESIIVEVDDEGGPFGAKGMGEVGLNPMAPAISNAIYDAIGIRMQSLPITDKKLLSKLHKQQVL